MRHLLLIAGLFAVGTVTSPAVADSHLIQFDVFGIRLGDTSEVAAGRLHEESVREVEFTPTPCVEQSIKRAQSAPSDETLHPTKPTCKTRAFAQLRTGTSVEIILAEDYPARPGISVVTRITAYYLVNQGPRTLSESEDPAALIAKYGRPTLILNDGTLVWGAAPDCDPHSPNCAPRAAYLESLPRQRIDLADYALAHRLQTLAETAIAEANARLR